MLISVQNKTHLFLAIHWVANASFSLIFPLAFENISPFPPENRHFHAINKCASLQGKYIDLPSTILTYFFKHVQQVGTQMCPFPRHKLYCRYPCLTPQPIPHPNLQPAPHLGFKNVGLSHLHLHAPFTLPACQLMHMITACFARGDGLGHSF